MNQMSVKVVSAATLAIISVIPVLVSPAHADVVVKTDADDAEGFLDIHQLTAGHGKGDRLQHTVTTFEKWSSRRLGDCSRLELQLPDAKRVVTIFWRRGELKARMTNPWVFPADVIGHPRVWRRDARTVVVSFHRDKLREVGESYKWRVVTFTPRHGCPEDDQSFPTWIDAAKGRGSYTHRL